MAVTLTLLSINKGMGPFIEVKALAVLSGNYIAGGDTLDFTQLYSQTDPAGRTLDSSALPVDVEADSMAALAGNTPSNYTARTYTNPNNGTAAVALTPATCKLQAYAGGTEQSSGAYGNAFLSDRVIISATFQSQA